MKKDKPAPQRIPMDKAKLDWLFKSKTQPGVVYLVSANPKNGELGCECRGFKTHGKCWHIREIVKSVGCLQNDIKVKQ